MTKSTSILKVIKIKQNTFSYINEEKIKCPVFKLL